MNNVKLLPYKIGSEGCRELASELGIGRIKLGQKNNPIRQNLVINWGCSYIDREISKVLNKPSAVANASNKLKTFKILKEQGIVVPDFTIDRDTANDWLNSGFKVVLRHKLSAHNGEGIEIIKPESSRLPRAPLYVKYIQKDHEYRVHVFNGKVIDITEKRRRDSSDRGGDSDYIRNLENGWVFCRDNVHPSNSVRSNSVRAVRALGLDFGAVDIIERQGKSYILEVNTAPGLQGTTLERYANAIRQYCNGGTVDNSPPRTPFNWARTRSSIW